MKRRRCLLVGGEKTLPLLAYVRIEHTLFAIIKAFGLCISFRLSPEPMPHQSGFLDIRVLAYTNCRHNRCQFTSDSN